MLDRLNRAESMRLAKAYIAQHEYGWLPKALSDPSCPQTALLGALLYACGHYYVAVHEAPPTAQFFAGPTEQTAALQVTLDSRTHQISGSASSVLETVYLVLTAIDHELRAASYLPADMRRARVLEVCKRLGIDEHFFSGVLRNQAP